MNEQREKAFIQQSIDTGLSSIQGNPFLAQQIINQERIKQPVKKKRISLALVLMMIVILACAATALTAAINESFNTWLYWQWPELAKALMPVNLSCEDQGIQLEILSAVNQESEMLVTYTLQDLEGDRIQQIANPFLNLEYNGLDFSTISKAPISEYDADRHKLTCVQYERCDKEFQAAMNGGVITAELRSLWPQVYENIDLTPYAETTFLVSEKISVPEGALFCNRAGVRSRIPDAMKILDVGDNPETPLCDSVFLSGVGILDGSLHIRIHCKNNSIIQAGSFSYPPYNARIEINHSYGVDVNILQWGGNDPQVVPEWMEYMIPFNPDQLVDMEIVLKITRHLPPILGEWKVQIPLRMIQNRADAHSRN